MISSGIYIHIPFCINKCNYCDYYSTEIKKAKIPDIFIKMLIKEIELTAENFNYNWEFNSIYIGGGSPALINVNDIKRILLKLKQYFSISKDSEITIEINPGENTYTNLKALRNLGINRVSLGFQSLDTEKLKLLTRNHNYNDCDQLLKYSRKAGFNNISVDMLYNIPNQTIDDWKSNLALIIEMAPDHIATFSLSAEKGTTFYSDIQNKLLSTPNYNIEHKMYIEGSKYLRDSGFTHYEISSFAKNGKESIHNLNYWNRNPYLAFGPSAHGFNGKKRYWNVSTLDRYINLLAENMLPIQESETLSTKNITNELFINGFRTKLGLKTSIFDNDRKKMIKKWNAYLYEKNNFIFLKPEFYHLSDEIISELIL